jgi:NDP-sugar pyrophosphorylase family protein
MSRPFAPESFFDLQETTHQSLFTSVEHAWEVLPKIADYLKARLRPAMLGTTVGSPVIGDQVHIGPGTVVEHGAMIKGPAWIGANCQIRNGAYLRENVIVGDGCVLGNSSEFKNCLLFNRVEVPHFNYVGDSILGFRSHLGAGVILSNVRLDRGEISVRHEEASFATNLRKFGAIIGDHTEIGCNAVLSPGSVIGKKCLLYPGIQWKGVLPANSIARLRQEISILENRG